MSSDRANELREGGVGKRKDGRRKIRVQFYENERTGVNGMFSAILREQLGAESFADDQSNGIGDQQQSNHLLHLGATFIHEFLEVEQTFQIPEGFFNGLITNDKFCIVRTGQLRLNHWRRPIRLRTPATKKGVSSASESSECGGCHETPVEDSTGVEGVSGWTEPMGSSVSVNTGDCSIRRGKSDADEIGGALCE